MHVASMIINRGVVFDCDKIEDALGKSYAFEMGIENEIIFICFNKLMILYDNCSIGTLPTTCVITY